MCSCRFGRTLLHERNMLLSCTFVNKTFFGGFFGEHMGCRLFLCLTFPNKNLIIFALFIRPNLLFFPQVSVWCSAV